MEKYENLEMEVVVFETEDIVTASGDIPLDPVQSILHSNKAEGITLRFCGFFLVFGAFDVKIYPKKERVKQVPGRVKKTIILAIVLIAVIALVFVLLHKPNTQSSAGHQSNQQTNEMHVDVPKNADDKDQHKDEGETGDAIDAMDQVNDEKHNTSDTPVKTDPEIDSTPSNKPPTSDQIPQQSDNAEQKEDAKDAYIDKNGDIILPEVP